MARTNAATAHRKATGRPCLTAARKKTSKRKNVRELATFSKRKQIIESLHKHGKQFVLKTYFNGLTGTQLLSAWKKILRWKSDQHRIFTVADAPSTSHHRTTRQKWIGTTLSEEAETTLANWIASTRKQGVPINNLMLTCKALDIAQKIGLSLEQFKASPTWVQGFLKRWGLSIRAKTRSGQANLEEGQAILDAFSSRIRSIIARHHITDIYNADQTGINYEYVPKKTVDITGAKSVWIKCSKNEKDRITAMVLADNHGTKYSLFIVMKTAESRVQEVVNENIAERHGFGKQLWKNEILELQERYPSRIYGNPSAWWNRQISIDFLRYHFGHRQNKDVPPVLLLWDDFGAHFTIEVLAYAKSVKVIVEKIPPGFTWICQPADVSWIKPMKSVLRRKWVDHLLKQLNASESPEAFKLERPTREDIVEWANDAWYGLPERTIKKGFEKCKIVDPPSVNSPNEVPNDAVVEGPVVHVPGYVTVVVV